MVVQFTLSIGASPPQAIKLPILVSSEDSGCFNKPFNLHWVYSVQIYSILPQTKAIYISRETYHQKKVLKSLQEDIHLSASIYKTSIESNNLPHHPTRQPSSPCHVRARSFDDSIDLIISPASDAIRSTSNAIFYSPHFIHHISNFMFYKSYATFHTS